MHKMEIRGANFFYLKISLNSKFWCKFENWVIGMAYLGHLINILFNIRMLKTFKLFARME